MHLVGGADEEDRGPQEATDPCLPDAGDPCPCSLNLSRVCPHTYITYIQTERFVSIGICDSKTLNQVMCPAMYYYDCSAGFQLNRVLQGRLLFFQAPPVVASPSSARASL